METGTAFYFSIVMMGLIGIIFPIKGKKADLFKYGLSMLIVALVFWAIVSEPLKTQFPKIYTILFWINVVGVWGGVYLFTSLFRRIKNKEPQTT